MYRSLIVRYALGVVSYVGGAGDNARYTGRGVAGGGVAGGGVAGGSDAAREGVAGGGNAGGIAGRLLAGAAGESLDVGVAGGVATRVAGVGYAVEDLVGVAGGVAGRGDTGAAVLCRLVTGVAGELSAQLRPGKANLGASLLLMTEWDVEQFRICSCSLLLLLNVFS